MRLVPPQELDNARAQWLLHNLKFHLMGREKIADIQYRMFFLERYKAMWRPD